MNPINSSAHILVAVSGGADSVALLHLLHESARENDWRLTVAHLHHGIRAKTADQDAAFVQALARRLKIPCVMGRAAVPALAKRRGLSLEMAAREARYDFLARMAKKVKVDRIATAHTADDQAETVLLKLIRGAGRGGLSGMAGLIHLQGIPVVRPLLRLSRRDIETYLKSRGIPWREDESNRDRAFLRNRVRHELLPLLEQNYNPGIRDVLLRTRDVLAAEDEWLDQLARKILGRLHSEKDGSLDRRGLLRYPLAARRRVILAWLIKQGVPELCLDFASVCGIDAVAEREKGSESLELAGGWKVRRVYDRLLAEKPASLRFAKPASVKPVKLNIPGVTRVPGLGLEVTATVGSTIIRDRGDVPGRLPARCTLNLEVLGKRSLWIRCRREGDRLAPYGMKGSKKIQDILVDAKVPQACRASIPVLDCGGDVVWIPGYRIARNWAVEKGAKKMLQLVLRAGRG